MDGIVELAVEVAIEAVGEIAGDLLDHGISKRKEKEKKEKEEDTYNVHQELDH